MQSREDALVKAQEAVRRAADAIRSGGKTDQYDYREDGLREEILEEITDAEGQLAAILTRNRYGSVVLNTGNLFFADLDLKPLSLWERILKLLGRPVPEPEAAALETLSRFCLSNPAWGFRVYRTFNGLRLLAPHWPQDPADPGTLAIQEQLGSDRLFTRLCRLQKSFRARLSPKPWRVGIPRPALFPREGAAAESRFQEWLDDYRQASEPHATCCFLKTVGSTHAHSGLAPLVQLHDDRTKAFSGLPLA